MLLSQLGVTARALTYCDYLFTIRPCGVQAQFLKLQSRQDFCVKNVTQMCDHTNPSTKDVFKFLSSHRFHQSYHPHQSHCFHQSYCSHGGHLLGCIHHHHVANSPQVSLLVPSVWHNPLGLSVLPNPVHQTNNLSKIKDGENPSKSLLCISPLAPWIHQLGINEKMKSISQHITYKNNYGRTFHRLDGSN